MPQFTFYFTFLGSLLILSEMVDTFEREPLECYSGGKYIKKMTDDEQISA
jgi:hypothetical protein